MKLLVKFEIKFLNFFTLKNLNNKKIYFLLPKNIVYTYRSKITNYNLAVVHKVKAELHNKTVVFYTTEKTVHSSYTIFYQLKIAVLRC